MDNPLSSILRPGPAAPANEQKPRETPVEGGDAAARRAIEQNTYPPARQVDWTMPQTQQPAYQPRQFTGETPQTVRAETPRPEVVRPDMGRPETIRAEAVRPETMWPDAARAEIARAEAVRAEAVRAATIDSPPVRIEPVRVEPVRAETARPVHNQTSQAQPASADDFMAGLEQAAMKDIGDGLAEPPVKRAPLSDEQRAKRRQEKRLARQAEADAGPVVSKDERAARRQEKLRRQDAKEKSQGTALQPAMAETALEPKPEKKLRRRDKGGGPSIAAPRERGIPWTAISFLVMVLIPAAISAFYYVVIASPQYQVETQFAVRGSGQSSMMAMGLPSMLGGSTSQTGDSYIVTSYVESLQLIRDVQKELGVDLRQYYTRDHIDWLYRIAPDMPLEKFTEYWRDMTDVSFNSTTGNTTLYVYAFSAEDSKAIADAVLKVSEKLVNELSESNRKQVMQVASKQVDRAEERLRKVQGEIRKLRVQEKITDPNTLITLQTEMTRSLQSQLSSLKTRLSALLRSVSADAPQAKALQKQIDALEGELASHEAQLGAKSGKEPKDLSPEEKANLAEVLNKFEELTIEQNFATQAYTTALAAFETAIVEAQRQERYFATFVNPTRPEIALYPLRYLDSFIAFLVLLAFWMVTQFLYRSFRDHSI
ncbi:hypothetical protein [Rhizobium sp.]